MRKNVMMRAASALLVAVLLTTCAISGTFAKYTTSIEGTDSARVAYWGFTSTSMDLTGLFSPQYLNTKVTADGTVKSADGDDVIAPGTTGSADFAFAYTGIGGTAAADTTAQNVQAPEVAYDFTVAVDGTCADDIKSNTNIQWKLDTNDWGTWDDMITDIKALSGDASGTKFYKPNELPAEFPATPKTHTIAWQWVFETSGAGEAAQDQTDTALGNKATLDTCSITITITATQQNANPPAPPTPVAP